MAGFLKPPDAPDPNKSARKQLGYEKQAGVSAALLNNVNQSNPYGSVSYQQSGVGPDGTPTFSANTQFANLPDFSENGISKAIMGYGTDLLNPQFDRQNASLDAKLHNQGIPLGSEAYNTATGNLANQQNDALTNLLLQGQGTALQAQQQQYLLPGQAFKNSLAPTYQQGISAPNYMGAEQANYQAKNDQYNNLIQGLFSIPQAAAKFIPGVPK